MIELRPTMGGYRTMLRPLSLAFGIRFFGGRSGPAYDTDASALFALMSSEPDSTRKTQISDTIGDLKDAGCWSLIDECWFMAAHDAQAGRLGWKRHRDLTAVNAPTHTTDRGYAGNGTTSYLSTNFVPSTDGINYKLNDASMGIYSRTNSDGAIVDFGALNAGSSNILQLLARSSGTLDARIHQAAAGQILAANADSRGFFVLRRSAATSQQAIKNGVSMAANTTVSTAIPSRAVFIGARNNNGSPELFSTRQYAFSFVAAAMSEQQQLDLYTIVQAYMTAIGAAV